MQLNHFRQHAGTSQSSDDVVVKGEDMDDISIKSSSTLTSDDPVLAIHPLKTKDGVIVKVQPSAQPTDPTMPHVPCDIVLVIDVSASMGTSAPAPVNDAQGGATKEDFGLTILDLTKHAARTIIETLNEGDRLGIVTFSTDAKAIQKLIPMTEANKQQANLKIDKIQPEYQTNLWRGILVGLELFQYNTNAGRVPAVMVLTDGQPTPEFSPGRGYVPKIQMMGSLAASIHTFGFGYSIESGLLKSIAEIGRGNYAFIPDAGMIGTVFVHAVAHLQSTFATKCTLHLTMPKSVGLKTTAGKTIDQQGDTSAECNKITIHLGNLQYGQSRDIYLENVNDKGQKSVFDTKDEKPYLSAKLTYSLMRAPQYVVVAERDLSETSTLSESEVSYHQSRSMICDFLSSFFALAKGGEYKTQLQLDPSTSAPAFQTLKRNIPAQHHDDPHNKSLMEDLVGESPAGQVSLAVSHESYLKKWGCHYFFSLWNAHAKQLCNSFKDPGPLMYNDNPFFIQCRDVLDAAFDNIPPPKRSRVEESSNLFMTPLGATPPHAALPSSAGSGPSSFSMSSYNQRDHPCFAASSKVVLASGREIPVCKLRKGLSVKTPAGPRRVVLVLQTRVSRIAVCQVGDLIVTPWHPIRREQGPWRFPEHMAEKEARYSGAVYSVLLQPDQDVDAHAVSVGGFWGVTLGHGLVSGEDARAHQFLGDHQMVAKALVMLGPRKNGVAQSDGVQRRKEDGLICGFKKAR